MPLSCTDCGGRDYFKNTSLFHSLCDFAYTLEYYTLKAYQIVSFEPVEMDVRGQVKSEHFRKGI